MEGDIDTSHLGFLHLGAVSKKVYDSSDTDQNTVANRSPEYVVRDTDFGVSYGAYRTSEDGGTYWRYAHFLFPSWTLPPINPFDINVLARAWVPIDDTHCMFVHVARADALQNRRRRQERGVVGAAATHNYLPNTTDWHGRWRLANNRSNDYGIDREVQRTGSFTGIDGINQQDQAITESMGEFTTHTWEHLVHSDNMISQTRRRLVRAARAFQKDGNMPPGAKTPDIFGGIRGGSFVAPKEQNFDQAYQERLAAQAFGSPGQQAAE